MTPSQSKMRAWRAEEAETDSAPEKRVDPALALLLLPLPRKKERGAEELNADEEFRET